MVDLDLQVAVTLKIESHKHFPIVGIWDANKTAETYQNEVITLPKIIELMVKVNAT